MTEIWEEKHELSNIKKNYCWFNFLRKDLEDDNYSFKVLKSQTVSLGTVHYDMNSSSVCLLSVPYVTDKVQSVCSVQSFMDSEY